MGRCNGEPPPAQGDDAPGVAARKRQLLPPPAEEGRNTKAKTVAVPETLQFRLASNANESAEASRQTAPPSRPTRTRKKAKKAKAAFSLSALRAIGQRTQLRASRQPMVWRVSDYEDHPAEPVAKQWSPAVSPATTPLSSPPQSPRERTGSWGSEDAEEDLQTKIERNALLLLELISQLAEEEPVRQSLLGNKFKERYPARFQRGLMKLLVTHLLQRGLVDRSGPGGGNVFMSLTPRASALLLSLGPSDALSPPPSPAPPPRQQQDDDDDVAAALAVEVHRVLEFSDRSSSDSACSESDSEEVLSDAESVRSAGSSASARSSGSLRSVSSAGSTRSSRSSASSASTSSVESIPLPAWIRAPHRDTFAPPREGHLVCGTVVSIQNTFGFISVPGSAEDLFFHTSSLKPGEWPTPRQQVSFYTKLNTTTGYLNAVHVRLVQGQSGVKESWHQRQRRQRQGRQGRQARPEKQQQAKKKRQNQVFFRRLPAPQTPRSPLQQMPPQQPHARIPSWHHAPKSSRSWRQRADAPVQPRRPQPTASPSVMRWATDGPAPHQRSRAWRRW